MISWTGLSSEDKLRMAYRAATEDMSPAYVAVLRQLPPGVRLQQAFGLWRMARDALVRQELNRGKSQDEAMIAAAQRLLRIDDDPTA
jgi:hypothetical protein